MAPMLRIEYGIPTALRATLPRHQRGVLLGRSLLEGKMLSVEERFWAKVNKNGPLWKGTPCWVWIASRNENGYGYFGPGMHHSPRLVRVHRYAYELLVGPIPEGLTIDHLCRNRPCVNPAHMETVTNKENILRGLSTGAHNARKTHCPQGHPYDLFNTYLRRDKGRTGRNCRACDNAR